MRFFICALDGMVLGIPADKTERVIPAPRTQNALYETENEEIFISLPAFFQRNVTSTPHGVLLKHSRRVVLLVPRIDVDLDISPQDIRALPECLRLPCFTGAAFVENDLILLLNTDRILEAAFP